MKKMLILVWLIVGLAECEQILPGNLIEGDIMLQADIDPWDRPMVDMKNKRWPAGVVPYELNETVFSTWDQYVIRSSLDEIEKDTCVRFVRRTYEKDYILIASLGGCWSYVGRHGLRQVLSLVAPLCISKGTIIHEFMHALGFWHEHSRSDRDEYVDVLWNNIMNKEAQVNFAKNFPEVTNFRDFPYDYRSVMHYDAFAFSKSPKLPTLKPKKSGIKLRDLGRAQEVGTLTETDRQKLNDLYECSGRWL